LGYRETILRSAVLSFALFCGDLCAQAPPFRAQVKIVQVPVRVTGKNGQNVDGLTARDFVARDNGVPQEITVDDFGGGLGSISLAIAIQSSGTSKLALAKIRNIAGMIQPLVIGANGQAAVLTFDSEIHWLQDFTPHDGKIRNAVKDLKASPSEGARMFDAIAEVAARMKQRKGRRVLLVISQSRDSGSQTKFEQALEAVEREGIEVFGAHYSSYAMTWIAKPEDFPEHGELNQMFFAELARIGTPSHIQALTRATGGADFPFLKERGIENAISQLGVEVHSQYILNFPQHGDATGAHQIEVSVPERRDLKIRARRAYWVDREN
jgi:VWFA-related protein